MHIPKTAGTSFIFNLYNNYGYENISRFHNLNLDQNLIQEFFENSSNKWYCGHIPNFNVRNIDKIENKYTILRDPFNKLVSNYEFFKLRRHLSSNKLILNLGLHFDNFCNAEIPEIKFANWGSYVRWFSKKDNFFDVHNPKSYDKNYI
jgi:hypothetical protein